MNGANLGRYWSKGPTGTLYVPAPILNRDLNKVENVWGVYIYIYIYVHVRTNVHSMCNLLCVMLPTATPSIIGFCIITYMLETRYDFQGPSTKF